MNYTIIDAHAHLWLRQDTTVDGLPIRTLENGRSLFMGEIRQMLPPFMVDGVNSAEVFLSNMDYAQVSAAVITQEFIDGIQNDYLKEVATRYPDRFFVCGMCEFRKPGYFKQAEQLIDNNFKAIKIPAHRLLLKEGRVMLNCEEMMQMFGLMEERNIILSIDLAEGSTQIAEMEEIIAQYPRLKIAIGHFGMATLPEWKQQILLARHPNVMIESGGITWLFNEEFYPFKGAVKAIREAEAYPGPSIIIAYAPCINHGLKKGMGKSQAEEEAAVKCGYWHLWRFNPALEAEGKNPFSLDSKEPNWDAFQDYLKGEVRFASVMKQYPTEAADLFNACEDMAKKRYQSYVRMTKMDWSE